MKVFKHVDRLKWTGKTAITGIPKLTSERIGHTTSTFCYPSQTWWLKGKLVTVESGEIIFLVRQREL